MTARLRSLVLLVVLAGAEAALAMNPDERLLFANGLYRRGLYELAIPEYEALIASDAAAVMHDLASFRRAECLRNLARTNEAAAAYESLITQFPQSPHIARAQYRRAEIDWQQGKLKDAATRFDALIKSNPPAEIESAALYYSGISHAALDRYDPAEKSLRRMLRDHPATTYADYARIALADLLDTTGGDLSEAVALYREVARKPETPALAAEALAKAGRLDYRAGRMSEASQAFAELAKKHKSDPWTDRVQLDAAWAHFYADQLDLAREAGEAGLKKVKKAERAPWLYFAANLERRAGNNEAAAGRYDELFAASPDEALASLGAFEAAGLAFQMEQYPRVLDLAARAGGDEARTLPLLWMQAGAHRALKQNHQAKEFYTRIVNEYSASDRAAPAAYQLALIADEAGDLAASAAAFRKIGEQYQDHELAADAWMAAASASLRSGDTASAIEAWAALIKLYPQYARLDEALMGAARAEVQRENDPAAIKALNRLLTDFPESRFLAEAAYLRGTLHEKADEFEPAEERYRRALDAKPADVLVRQIQNRRVAVLQRQGRNADAAALMNELLAAGNLQALPSPLLEWLARWNLEQKDFPEAQAAGETLAATATAPGWELLGHYIAGVAARARGLNDAAEKSFTAAAAIPLKARESALASFELGELAIENKKYDVALGHFARAAERAAADTMMDVRARSYLRLGFAHEMIENRAEANRHYLIVGVLFDDPSVTPESLFRAAAAQEAMQQLKQRDQTLAELRERYPDNEWTRRADERWENPPQGKTE